MSFSSVSLVLQKLHQNYHSCFIKVKAERQIYSSRYLAVILGYPADEKEELFWGQFRAVSYLAIFNHILEEGIDCGINCACTVPRKTTVFSLTEL